MTPFERRLIEVGCEESTARGLADIWLRPGGAGERLGGWSPEARQRGGLELDPAPPTVRVSGTEQPERMVDRVTRELAVERWGS